MTTGSQQRRVAGEISRRADQLADDLIRLRKYADRWALPIPPSVNLAGAALRSWSAILQRIISGQSVE
jgi:hypothetical protein